MEKIEIETGDREKRETGRITVKLNELERHPAHDRTRYDLPKLVGLTVQIVARKLDAWQPIVVAPNGRGAYQIISGRRRFLATVLAYGVEEWEESRRSDQCLVVSEEQESEEKKEEGVTLGVVDDVVTQMVGTLAGEYANDPLLNVEAAVAKLLGLYGEHEIEVVLFDGDEQAQILALQAANANREEPDMLGLAHTYKCAMEAGATPAVIARNSGVDVTHVLNHLALTQIPPTLAGLIADGTVGMGVARLLSAVSPEKANGIAQFIVYQKGEVTVKRLRQVGGFCPTPQKGSIQI